jgi:hypothetical protein
MEHVTRLWEKEIPLNKNQTLYIIYRICFFFKILFDLIAKIFKPEEILGDYLSIK